MFGNRKNFALYENTRSTKDCVNGAKTPIFADPNLAKQSSKNYCNNDSMIIDFANSSILVVFL